MIISRRGILAGGAALAAAGPAMAKTAVKGGDWYGRAIVIDGLGSLSDPYGPETQTRLSVRGWAEIQRTGVTAINWTIVPVGNAPDIFDQAMKGIADVDAIIAANPDRLRLVKTAADIVAAKANGELGIIYGTQDTSMVGAKLDRVAELKAKGVRVMQLTYNLRNLSGDGALEPDNAGLSKLGRATIARIEKERLLLDLSHGGARTIREAIAESKRPATISHTGCRALHDHPRNVGDAEMKALADKGGVVGIYFMPFLSASSKPTGAELIAHIEHAANVCGEDHVGIGTDGGLHPIPINAETWKRAREAHEARSAAGFAAPGEGPDVLTIVHDYNRLDRFQRLAAELARRRWSPARIEKLLGTNLLRLYREAWGG